TDSAGLRTERTFTIQLADVNDAPDGVALTTNTIDENAANNSGHFLHFLAFETEGLRVGFRRGGKDVIISPFVEAMDKKFAKAYPFEFPGMRSETEPFDEVFVETEGRRKLVAFVGLDLTSSPIEAKLPAIAQPEPIDIGNETRSCVALSTRRPVECESILPPQSRLRFSFGQPSRFHLKGENKPTVLLTITGAKGNVETHEFEIERAGSRKTRWEEADVDLAAFAGFRTSFRFELKTETEQVGVAALGSPTVFAAGSNQPTVLLVTSDTHRFDFLGSTIEGAELRTPTLDKLAEEGIFFEDAFTATNVTNPSHIALMTATHPRDTVIVNNNTRLADTAPTLAEAFREAGYVTYASVCANHLAHPTSGLGQGFDRFAFPKSAFYDAADAVDRLEPWMADAEGLPLFVWLHVFDAHEPYEPPAPFHRHYYDRENAGEDGPFEESRPPINLPNDADPDTVFPPSLHGLRDLSYPLAQYRAEITYLDQELGRVFGWPRFEEALIAVTADHGESFGEHGVYYDHAGAFPVNIHVPLILKAPGLPVGM
ncbi:MAG: sulfatase-like hydrolase/transferase, partial [Planctomycetota bacterium]